MITSLFISKFHGILSRENLTLEAIQTISAFSLSTLNLNLIRSLTEEFLFCLVKDLIALTGTEHIHHSN